MLASLKHALARANNLHLPKGRDVFLFSTPRGGSTWLSELVLTQPGFKPSDEPFNLRDALVARELARRGIHSWHDLYQADKLGAMEDYVDAIASGRCGVTNPFFYRNHFRIVTSRICFKILHAGEDRIAWFRKRFSGDVVVLLRHPAPVATSRKVLPRLEAFLESDYRSQFPAETLAHAERIARSGTYLQKAVLDWCFQTAPALRSAEPEWTVLTYEQLVLEPDPLVDILAERLALEHPHALRSRLRVPSASTHQSDATTRSVLEGDTRSDARSDSRRWLVEKWVSKVDAAELRRAMESLAVFGIDTYRPDDPLPTESYWLR